MIVRSVKFNLNRSLVTYCIAFFLGVSAQVASAQGESTAGLPVRTTVIELQSAYIKERVFTGRIEAGRVSEAGFEIGGKVLNVHVDEGDSFATGDVLAVLDAAQVNAERKEAVAIVEQSRANLLLSESTLARVRSVFTNNGASKQALDEAQNRRDAAAAAVKRADAALERIDVILEKTSLVAPFDGVVIRRQMDEGRVTSVGVPVLTLQERGASEARIALSNDLADNYRVGESATLFLRGRPISARVKSIRAKRDERMQTVDVVFSVSDATLVRPGDLVALRLAVRMEASGVWVPLAALTETVRGLWSVYVIDDNHRAQRKALDIIYQHKDAAYVRGALSDGDRIVAVGTHRIVPGQQVRLLDDSTLARRGDDGES